MKKLTHDQYVLRLKENNPNIKIVDTYVNANTKSLHICLKCNKTWNIKCSHALNGHGCPQPGCKQSRKTMSKKKVVDLLAKNKNFNATIIEYGGMRGKSKFRCNVCSSEWTTDCSSIIHQKHGCRKCYALSRTYSHEEFNNRLKERSNLELDKLYTKGDTIVYYKCTICDYKFSGSLWLTNCEKCNPMYRWNKKSHETYVKQLRKANKYLKVIGDYQHSTELLTHKDTRCGHTFEIRPYHALRGSGCSLCWKKAYSTISIKWLDYISKRKGVYIQHAENSFEFRTTTGVSVDGYCEETNTVYEFLGDVFHGNPNIFNPSDNTHPYRWDVTARELHDKDVARFQTLIDAGYKVKYIYESSYKSGNKKPRKFKDGQTFLGDSE